MCNLVCQQYSYLLFLLGVNSIKLLHAQVTRVAIVFESKNNNFTCELHSKALLDWPQYFTNGKMNIGMEIFYTVEHKMARALLQIFSRMGIP